MLSIKVKHGGKVKAEQGNSIAENDGERFMNDGSLFTPVFGGPRVSLSVADS